AAPGGLPLLQFALAQLWEARDTARGVIPASAVQATGGVEGALARHADEVLLGLPAPRRAASRRLLMRLVTKDHTRNRGTARALGAERPEEVAALEALVRGRLLVARPTEEGAEYELAHEALLRGWPTLERWLEEEAGTRHTVLRLGAAASEWE